MLNRELKKGTTPLLAPRPAREATPRHGYELSKLIESRSGRRRSEFHASVALPAAVRARGEAPWIEGRWVEKTGRASPPLLPSDFGGQASARDRAARLVGVRERGLPGRGGEVCVSGTRRSAGGSSVSGWILLGNPACWRSWPSTSRTDTRSCSPGRAGIRGTTDRAGGNRGCRRAPRGDSTARPSMGLGAARGTERWVEFVGEDVRVALRTLLRTPGYTMLAVLALAIGIGANVAIFSIVDAVLLNPLGFRDADRLVSIRGSAPGSDLPEFGLGVEFFSSIGKTRPRSRTWVSIRPLRGACDPVTTSSGCTSRSPRPRCSRRSEWLRSSGVFLPRKTMEGPRCSSAIGSGPPGSPRTRRSSANLSMREAESGP